KLVFDAGGTNLRIAVSADGRSISRVMTLPTPKTYRRLVLLFRRMATTVLEPKSVTAVAGGVPGTLDLRHEKIDYCTQLPGWAHKPLKHDLERLFGVPARIENDSALAGLGEIQFGKLKNVPIVAYIGFGTGVGGCRYVRGKIDVRSVGFEPGRHYLFLPSSAHKHPTPHHGDWESSVSGVALKLRFQREAKALHEKKIWRQVAADIGTGLVNVTLFWSPNVIVLGGSLMKRLPFSVIRKEFVRRLRIFPHKPKIVRGVLGDYAGLYGGLALLQTFRSTHGR
ncbi:MAG: ROK family protein, partial [bacterium]